MQADVDLLEPGRGVGVTLNASVGGLRIAVDYPLQPGDFVLLRVRFPSGSETVERAQVVWSHAVLDGNIAGLQFVGQDR